MQQVGGGGGSMDVDENSRAAIDVPTQTWVTRPSPVGGVSDREPPTQMQVYQKYLREQRRDCGVKRERDIVSMAEKCVTCGRNIFIIDNEDGDDDEGVYECTQSCHGVGPAAVCGLCIVSCDRCVVPCCEVCLVETTGGEGLCQRCREQDKEDFTQVNKTVFLYRLSGEGLM